MFNDIVIARSLNASHLAPFSCLTLPASIAGYKCFVQLLRGQRKEGGVCLVETFANLLLRLQQHRYPPGAPVLAPGVFTEHYVVIFRTGI